MDSVNVLSFVCPTDFTLIRFLVNLETLTIKTTSELVHINTIQNTIAKEVYLTSSTLFLSSNPILSHLYQKRLTSRFLIVSVWVVSIVIAGADLFDI